MIKIICFGPGPKFKGGISNYNTSLAKALDRQENTEVHIVSWTNQYPAIFPRDTVDRTSKADLLEGTDVKVHYLTNYNSPLTWMKTVQFIKSLEADKVIFQWSVSIQGPPIGYMVTKLSKVKEIEVIVDLHFVTQKENSAIDVPFTKYGIKNANTFIAHAYKTVDELKETFPNRTFSVNETGVRDGSQTTVIKLFHPIYDLFKPDPNFDIKGFKETNGLKKNVFLFFGFIRKYKGLHDAIRAFHQLSKERDDVSFLICGESFWHTLSEKKISTKIKSALFSLASSILRKSSDDEKEYKPLELIEELGLQDEVMLVNKFVPNEDVHKYFQVSDVVVLFYEFATPSGIESLSYNFKKPLLATKVGHFPETIHDGVNGYLAEASDIDSMTAQMRRFIENPLPPENIAKSTETMSWEVYAQAILKN